MVAVVYGCGGIGNTAANVYLHKCDNYFVDLYSVSGLFGSRSVSCVLGGILSKIQSITEKPSERMNVIRQSSDQLTVLYIAQHISFNYY